jgi:Skp family chaperone for outer membrane proteins
MKIALLALSAVLAAPLAAAAQSAAPKPKPINYEARAKACDAQLKGQYSFETKIVARGFCLSGVKQDQYTYTEAKR